jgi:hypothetical protein
LRDEAGRESNGYDKGAHLSSPNPQSFHKSGTDLVSRIRRSPRQVDGRLSRNFMLQQPVHFVLTFPLL